MNKDMKNLMKAYMLLMKRTVEILPDDMLIMLEQDHKWKFFFRMATEYKNKVLGAEPN